MKRPPAVDAGGLISCCEQVCKPGSVFDSHLSSRIVANAVKPPRERPGKPVAPIAVLLRIEFTATDTLEPSGELLPRLSTLTLRQAARRYISVALFLKSPSAGVTRYPCPVEPGLSSGTGFRLVPATVWLTRMLILQNVWVKVNVYKTLFIGISLN